MGGVASFVEDTFSAVGDVVGDVGKAAETVAGGASDFIFNDVVEPVMTEVFEPVTTVVSRTVDAAMEDPIGTAAQVGTAIYAPALLPAVNGAVALSRGADFEDALQVSALSYAGQQAGQFVGGEVSAGLEDSFGKAGSSAAGKVAGAATSTAIRGGDVEDVLTSGIVGAGTGAALGQIPGFGELDPWQQKALGTITTASLLDKNSAVPLADQLLTGIINTATGAGTDDASSFGLGDTTFQANPLQTTLPYVPPPSPPQPPPRLTRPAASRAPSTFTPSSRTPQQPSRGIASVQPDGFEQFASFDQNEQGIPSVIGGVYG